MPLLVMERYAMLVEVQIAKRMLGTSMQTNSAQTDSTIQLPNIGCLFLTGRLWGATQCGNLAEYIARDWQKLQLCPFNFFDITQRVGTSFPRAASM